MSVLLLVLVIGLLLAGWVLGQKRQGRTPWAMAGRKGSGAVSVLSRVPAGPGSWLVLLEAEGRRVLILVGQPGQVLETWDVPKGEPER